MRRGERARMIEAMRRRSIRRPIVVAVAAFASILATVAVAAPAIARGGPLWPSQKVERTLEQTYLAKHFVLPEAGPLVFALVSSRNPRYGAVYGPKLLAARDAAAGSVPLTLAPVFYHQTTDGRWADLAENLVPPDVRKDLATTKPGPVHTDKSISAYNGGLDYTRTEKYVAPGNACHVDYDVTASGNFAGSFPPVPIPTGDGGIYLLTRESRPIQQNVAEMDVREHGGCISVGNRDVSCHLSFAAGGPGYVAIEVAGFRVRIVVVPFRGVADATSQMTLCNGDLLTGFPEVLPLNLSVFLQETRPDYWLDQLHAEKTVRIAVAASPHYAPMIPFTFNVNGRDPLHKLCTITGNPLEDLSDCKQSHSVVGAVH